jgi:hypothetical protein
LLFFYPSRIVPAEFRTPFHNRKRGQNMATVEYRDIQGGEAVDPIAFLFKTEKPYVAESALTPELVLRYYQALVEKIPVRELVSKGEHQPFGLESLQSLVRHEPDPNHLHLGDWRALENDPVLLERSVRDTVSSVMQYLPIQEFRFPEWKDTPRRPHPEYRFYELLEPLSADALLLSRRNKLYFVEATWAPKTESSWHKEKPRHTVTFVLSALAMSEVTWQDARIIERIKDGRWGDCRAVAASFSLVLKATVDACNNKARWLKRVAKDVEFAQDGIYSGR